MNRLLLIIISLFVFISTQAFGQIRGTIWGESPAVVKKKEGKNPLQEHDDAIAYKTSISGLETTLLYGFTENKLSSVFYYITEEYVNDNNHIRDYENLKRQLIEKYGEPKKDDIDWSDTLYEDDPENYGLAVSAGHLSFTTYWKVDNNMTIVLSLTGENFECELGLIYTSDEYYKNTNEVDPAL